MCLGIYVEKLVNVSHIEGMIKFKDVIIWLEQL